MKFKDIGFGASGAIPTASEIRAALERVVASPQFSKSPRLADFLRYVVEATLAGTAIRLKAYTIATDALGRDQSFDPQSDPIVRVEAGRLRQALARYHATDGRNDDVVIEITRGSYIPAFRRPSGLARVSHLVRFVRQQTETFRQKARLPKLARYCYRLGVGLVAAVVAVFLAAQYLLARHSNNESSVLAAIGTMAGLAGKPGNIFPAIYVEPVSIGGTASASPALGGLRDRLRGALAHFDEIGVLWEVNPNSRVVIDFRLSTVADVGPDGETNLTFHLINTGTTVSVWSSRYDTANANLDVIVRDVVSAIAQPYGAIHAHNRMHLSAGTLHPAYACLIEAFDAWPNFDINQDRSVSLCLDLETRANPTFAAGFAALATYNYRKHLFDDVTASDVLPLDRALTAAQRAVALAPHSARAHQTLMDVYFHRGEFEQAWRSGQKAMLLNPYDDYAGGAYGIRMIFAGEVEKGLPLVRKYFGHRAGSAGRVRFALFLGHYLKGDLQTARLHASNITNRRYQLGYLARALLARKAGESAAARAELTQLVAMNGHWQNVSLQMRRLFPAPMVANRLVEEVLAIQSAAVH